MECARCKAIGAQPKTYRYARHGQWRIIQKCRHKRQEVRQAQVRRKRGPNIDYTDEMDAFILLHYPTDNKSRHRRGMRVMALMRDQFEAKFGVAISKGQIIGRWHRLRVAAIEAARNNVRQVPSLPVLKFMHGECGVRNA